MPHTPFHCVALSFITIIFSTVVLIYNFTKISRKVLFITKFNWVNLKIYLENARGRLNLWFYIKCHFLKVAITDPCF